MDSLDSNGKVITAGATVALTEDAAYYGGKAVPGWVKGDTWIVASVNGDRVVLGRNVSGANNINSPVNSRHVKVVSSTASPVKPETKEQAVQDAQPATQGTMRVSEQGVGLIARYEGCRLQAYKCPAGVWTIGYGHTAGVKPGDILPSTAAALELLKEDLRKYGDYVNACVKKGKIMFPLNQNRFDALTSFCYNCGNGNLQKLVEGRDAATVADKMLLYNKGGGKELPGLTKRRKEERELFLRK